MDAGHAGLVAALVLSWLMHWQAGRPRGSVTVAQWRGWLAELRAARDRAS